MADNHVKLIITEVKEPRAVGNTEVLDFLAKIGEGHAMRYGAWNKALYPFIKKDTTIDADVETKESEKMNDQGEHYVNRKVTQIYADGKPILQQRQGGGYQRREDNPDTRRSIERQTSLNAAIELMKIVTVKPIPMDFAVLEIAEGFYQWVSEGKMPKEATEQVVTVHSPTPAPSSRPDVSQAVQTEQTGVSVDADWLNDMMLKAHWTEKTARSWIKAKFAISSDKPLVEVLSVMPPAQREAFEKELTARAEAA